MQSMQPPRLYGSTVARDKIGGASVRTSPTADEMRRGVEENPVIVIGKRGCCMCRVACRLMLGIGVNPAVYEVGEEEEGDVADRLREIIPKDDDDRGKIQFPAVFVGGRLFGGLERVMTCHISGELVPVLMGASSLGEWDMISNVIWMCLCLHFR